MPELPEVETIRRQLDAVLPGRVIASVAIDDARLSAPVAPETLAGALAGRRLGPVSRRGKHLLLALDGQEVLVVHLRMTGQLYWREGAPDAARPHRRALLRTADGGSLLYCDLRRFGRWWMLPAGPGDLDRQWRGRVGVEPLSAAFTAQRLAGLLAGRATPVKAALLDQRLVAGIGNIYADEALFQAGVHPLRPAGSLTPEETRRLHRAIRDRLRAGIAAGGTSIDRYRDLNGDAGAMQTLLRVHRRAGRPCPRCGTLVRKTRVAQRGTYLCDRCQPRC